jgi:ribonuclease Z
VEGRTRAGHESYFRVRELGIALDIGRGPDLLIPVSNVFISHAHLDHAVGIPFYAGQRHLQRMPGGRVYVPVENLDDFQALMEIHCRLERTEYDIELIGMAPGDIVPISRTLRVRAHQATHRVPARAYEVIEMRHHLKKEFIGLDRHELAELRAAGTSVHDEIEVSVLYYTGDTDRGILERSARQNDGSIEAIYHSEVLLIECSFIADGHHWRAERYRHIHFDDLAEFADRFENRLIVLTHFSRRYSRDEIIATLRQRCPAVLRDRIRLAFPEPWQRIG